MSNPDLTGLRVTLDRKECCCANAIIARTQDDDGYELRCAECGSRRGTLPQLAIDFLQSTVRVFGTPHAPIFIPSAITRKPSMTRDDVFPSKFLKASDVPTPIDVVIKSAELIEMQQLNGDKE